MPNEHFCFYLYYGVKKLYLRIKWYDKQEKVNKIGWKINAPPTKTENTSFHSCFFYLFYSIKKINNWILELFRRCNIFYLSFYVPILVPFGPVVSDWLIDFWCFNATFNNISATMYIMATSFSGGGSRSTRREPLTMGKQLIIFITCGCKPSAPFFVIYKAGREPTPYWFVRVVRSNDLTHWATRAPRWFQRRGLKCKCLRTMTWDSKW